MAQEKSRAVLITPERAVRNSVFAILRVAPSNRFCMMASLTPSTLVRISCMVIAGCSRLSSMMRRRSDVDDEGAILPAFPACSGVDDDRGETRFDDGGAGQ